MTRWRWRGVGLAAAVGLALAAGAVGDERRAEAQEREKMAKAAKAAELGFVLDPDVAPKAEHIERARYPKELIDQRRAGTVLVLFGISPKGLVVAPEVLESSPGFDAAALKAIGKWRFTPARKDGAAVGTVAVVPVTFKVY